MSLIQQIKRAAINHGMYKGTVDDNWEPADRLMFHRLCSRFHGNYTDHPSRNNQNPEFLEWLDKYKDSEYSEERSTHAVINPGGADLRQFIPDRQPVNTEGVSRQEAKERDARVNENHIKLPTQQQKKDSVPDPAKVVEEEKKNELSNQSSLRSSDENGSETDSQSSSEQSNSEDGQNQTKDLDNREQNASNSGDQEKANSGAQTEPAKTAKPSGSNKPAPFVKNSNNTIKTR